MLFNTLEFALFLVIAFLGSRLLEPWRRARHLWLLACSYLFYSCWNPWYLLLMLASTGLDYAVGLALGRGGGPARRRALLSCSVAGNLGLLGFFKYGNFVLENAETAASWAGVYLDLGRVPGVLPVGISFYTFQTLSYAIDVYRRRLAPTRSLLDFALFVAFFPQLVAGPILRAAEFLPQFDARPRLDRRAVAEGVFLILCGLWKKMVIADTLAHHVVSPFFQHPTSCSAVETLLSLWSFYLALYCDFSGYSDVAVGAGLLFGFHIPPNFDRPAFSVTPLEHWRRWHISFQAWMRDYLFIPLGGSRGAPWRTELNVVLVFLVGGIWHGAAWTFAAAGLWNGLWAVGWRHLFRGEPRSGWTSVASRFATFNVVAIGMVFMRDYPLTEALAALGRLARWDVAWAGHLTPAGLGLLALAIALHLSPRDWVDRARASFAQAPAVAVAAAVVWSGGVFSLVSGLAESFFYFRF